MTETKRRLHQALTLGAAADQMDLGDATKVVPPHPTHTTPMQLTDTGHMDPSVRPASPFYDANKDNEVLKLQVAAMSKDFQSA